MSKSDRIDVYLVAGGKYHNIDHARLEIMKLLAEQPRIKVQVGADYSDIDAICSSDFLITYTCDLVPTARETARLQDYIRGGAKWFALMLGLPWSRASARVRPRIAALHAE